MNNFSKVFEKALCKSVLKHIVGSRLMSISLTVKKIGEKHRSNYMKMN